MDEPINLVLFSGTDDRLNAAAVLAAGAAALGRPVNIFLQYWALDAFRADRIRDDHGLAPEAGPAGRAAVDALRAAGQATGRTPCARPRSWAVDIQACSLSMDLLGINESDLDPPRRRGRGRDGLLPECRRRAGDLHLSLVNGSDERTTSMTTTRDRRRRWTRVG